MRASATAHASSRGQSLASSGLADAMTAIGPLPVRCLSPASRLLAPRRECPEYPCAEAQMTDRPTASNPHISNSALRDFLKSEAVGGIVLIAAAALAMIAANSALAGAYFHLLH